MEVSTHAPRCRLPGKLAAARSLRTSHGQFLSLLTNSYLTLTVCPGSALLAAAATAAGSAKATTKSASVL